MPLPGSPVFEWQQTHISQQPDQATTGSFTEVVPPPSSSRRRRTGSNPARVVCLQSVDPPPPSVGRSELTHSRHVPSGATTRSGRSNDSASKLSRSTVAIVSNRSPSSERAMMLA